jgi:hypothetical protein
MSRGDFGKMREKVGISGHVICFSMLFSSISLVVFNYDTNTSTLFSYVHTYCIKVQE